MQARVLNPTDSPRVDHAREYAAAARSIARDSGGLVPAVVPTMDAAAPLHRPNRPRVPPAAGSYLPHPTPEW